MKVRAQVRQAAPATVLQPWWLPDAKLVQLPSRVQALLSDTAARGGASGDARNRLRSRQLGISKYQSTQASWSLPSSLAGG